MRQSTVVRAPELFYPLLKCGRALIGFHLIVFLVCILLPLALSLPSTGDDHLGNGDGCHSYGESSSSVYVQWNLPGHSSLKNVCGDSGSFCFPTTLPSFLDGEDGCQAASLDSSENLVSIGELDSGWPPKHVVYKLSDGRKVLCSSIDTECGASDCLTPENKNVDPNDVGFCKGTLLPDAWIQKSSGLTISPDENAKDIDSSLHIGPLSHHVEINPPLLDWGVNRLYHPSLAFLTVANTYNDSVLHVYEPFSTDPQYYAHDFEKLTLEPGEAASIAVVFLPRWLGLSSAHLVLQTSFGGFIIHAKGKVIESPYMVQPMVGFDVSPDGRLSKVMSLHNPFDDVLYVEGVMAWVSVFSGNTSHSANVVCRANTFPQSSDGFSSLWNGNELGWSLLGIRPHRHWKIRPHDTETILEMSLSLHTEGSVYGAVCIQLQSSSQDVTDAVIVPLEAEVQGSVGYHSLSGSVAVFFDSLVPCDGRRSLFSLSLRNDAPYLLSVVIISEVTDGIKLFKVKYAKGLILYPGTVTLVGLINYASQMDSLDIPPDIPSVSSNCALFVVTNDSTSPQIEIPCRDLVDTCSRRKSGIDFVESKGSYIGLRFQHEKEKSSNARTGSLGSIIEEQSLIKLDLLEIVEADELILKNWRSQGTMVDMSVLDDHEVLFPMVQVGTHYYKWITVKNPSEKPVVMQLVLNSGVLVDQCKSADDLSEHSFLRKFSHSDSIETMNGFSIPESAIIEAFVHPSGRATFGPIVFRPSKRCIWRSSALIRNNLSGLEWLPVQGVGGSSSLVLLEGSKPVQKLEFNLDLPMSLTVSPPESLSHMERTSSSCTHMLSKELFVKNAGELPLEVMKLEVSGTDCGKDGFTIHTCKGFALAPGESTLLLISYQADFSTAVIQRDLELALAAGILVIPMKASLPSYMISLCRKSSLWTLLRKLFLVFFVVASVVLLVFFRFLLHMLSLGTEDYFMKSNGTIATISRVGKPSRTHRNPRDARSVREDQKLEAGFASQCPDRPVGILNNTIRIQGMQDLDHQKRASLSPPTSKGKPMEEVHYSGLSDAPQTANLTVRTAREKGRRRKRRTAGAGAGLASKLEVSSSQSGNSTPSSPLSPNASTPRQVWLLSQDTPENQFARVADDQIHQKEQVFEASTGVVPESEVSIKSYDKTWLSFSCEQSSLPGNQIGRAVLLPSATFPGTGWRAPGVASPKFLASTSPIAPHARAPGSNLSKEKIVKRDKVVEHGKEFTYSIWGNHFPEHLMGRPNEVLPKVSDASEGQSQSFFTRGPQSLMTMSSERSVSLGSKLPSYDVDCLHQMG